MNVCVYVYTVYILKREEQCQPNLVHVRRNILRGSNLIFRDGNGDTFKINAETTVVSVELIVFGLVDINSNIDDRLRAISAPVGMRRGENVSIVKYSE